MKQFFTKYLLIPTGIYFTLLIAAIITIHPDNSFYGMVMTYALAFPLLTIIWWFVAFSRWLYKDHFWKTIPFLVANLAVGVGIIAIGLSAAIGLIENYKTLALMAFSGGGVGGIFWFCRSLYLRLFNSDWDYNNIHMMPLDYDPPSFALPKWQHGKSKIQSSAQKEKQLVSTSVKPNASIFRSVSDSSPDTFDDLGSVFIPPRDNRGLSQKRTTASISTESVYRPNPQPRLIISTPSGSFVKEAKKYVNRQKAK